VNSKAAIIGSAGAMLVLTVLATIVTSILFDLAVPFVLLCLTCAGLYFWLLFRVPTSTPTGLAGKVLGTAGALITFVSIHPGRIVCAASSTSGSDVQLQFEGTNIIVQTTNCDFIIVGPLLMLGSGIVAIGFYLLTRSS
jgi:hypothetical protein